MDAGRVERLLFILLLGSYAYFYQSLGHNETARFDLTRALLEDHSVAVDRFRHNSTDLVVQAGRTYSNKAPGASLLALVPFRLAGVLAKRLGLPEWAYWDVVAYLTTLSCVGLLSALAGVTLFRLAYALTGSAFAALLAALALGLGSIAFPFATLFFGHQIAAALLVFAFALVFQRRHSGKAAAHPNWTWLAAGALVGYAVVTEYPAAMPAAGVTLYALDTLRREQGRLRLAACFGLGVAAAAAVLAAYNMAAFGRVLFVSYQAYAQEGSTAIYKAHAQGLVGVHWPGLTAFGAVLAELLLLPRRGLFFLNPICALVPVGLLLMARERRMRAETVLIVLIAGAMLIFNACYGDSVLYWGGGGSTGPRHLLPMLPFLALPLAFAAQRMAWLFHPLLLASALFMLVATAVDPRAPFYHLNPMRDLLVPSYLHGQLALHRGAFFAPVEARLPAGALNLGALLGLSPAWQMAPLLGFWALLGSRLMRRAGAPHVSRVRALYAVGLLAAAVTPGIVEARRPLAQSSGLLGFYYAHPAWNGREVFARHEAPIDFDWGREPAAIPLRVPFSVEWLGGLRVTTPGAYAFHVDSEDNRSRLEIDGRPVLDNQGYRGPARSSLMWLGSGVHPLALRYKSGLGASRVRLLWVPPGGALQVIPAQALVP